MSEATVDELNHLIDCVDLIYKETIQLCRTLSDDQAAFPTGCPGWSVQDHLAHMVGFEQSLSGSPEPAIEIPDFDHMKHDFSRYVEGHVHARRALPFAAVVDEMAGLHPRRIAQLRDQAAQGDIELTSPWGSTGSLSGSLNIRVLDLWAHEQDIRLATGTPVRTDGIDGDVVETRTLVNWQSVLPRSVEGPGQVGINFTDGNQSNAVVSLDGDTGGGPSVSISGTRSALTNLAFGRQPTDDYLANVTFDGDVELRDRVIPHLIFTP